MYIVGDEDMYNIFIIFKQYIEAILWISVGLQSDRILHGMVVVIRFLIVIFEALM